ncbi:MAG: hypothetical protein WBP50_02505 [Chlorobium sp.]
MNRPKRSTLKPAMLRIMLLLMFPSPAAAGLFARKGVEGTMVLSSLKTQVGWYVGYIETEDEVWFFALNIDVLGEADLPLRKQLVREALQAKGIIR